jgi:cbb3-type cytochrome c oxidase subunit III
MKKIIAAALMVMAVGSLDMAMADGAATYKAKCLPCHGADGKGTAMAPAFAGNEFIKTGTEEQITDVITKGRQGAEKKYKQFAIGMPAQKLTADEAKDVVAYLKSLAK